VPSSVAPPALWCCAARSWTFEHAYPLTTEMWSPRGRFRVHSSFPGFPMRPMHPRGEPPFYLTSPVCRKEFHPDRRACQIVLIFWDCNSDLPSVMLHPVTYRCENTALNGSSQPDSVGIWVGVVACALCCVLANTRRAAFLACANSSRYNESACHHRNRRPQLPVHEFIPA